MYKVRLDQSRVKDLSTLEICLYADGDERYISIEGIPYKEPAQSWTRYWKGSEISALFAGAQQLSYRGYYGKSFELLAPPDAQVTLFWVRQLQHIEVALQNRLAQDQDAVHAGLMETM